MIVCFQGGTMPGMWYTLSLYLSGMCHITKTDSESYVTSRYDSCHASPCLEAWSSPHATCPDRLLQQKVRTLPSEEGLVCAAEREMTVAWGWVLVGTALSQVIGAPIAAGGDCQCLHSL